MSTVGYTLFDTSSGALGIAWSDRGVTGVQWPEPTPAATAGRLVAKAGGGALRDDPPVFVRDAIARLRTLVDEGAADLTSIPIDLPRLAPFRRRVYELARRIPAGTTKTYGELAAEAGSPGAARAVGRAMADNPLLLVIPCHRVVAAGGAPGGFSAPGGLDTKQRLLTREQAPERHRSRTTPC